MKKILADFSVSTRLLVSAGLKRGLDITFLPSSKNTFLVQIGQIQYIWKETSFGNPVAMFHVCKNKLATHNLLRLFGYSVPDACVFQSDQKEEAMEWLSDRTSVVVKPLDAAHGDDITVLPKGRHERNEAWERVLNGRKTRDRVLIEEYVAGEDYRFLIVGNTCVYVMHRIPATIVGDGVLTVEQLIQRENKRPSRGKRRYSGYYSPITIDSLLRRNLAEIGLALDSVPEYGCKVVLRKVCNVGRGGTEEDMTPYVSPLLMNDAVSLSRRLGMDVVAIDIRCPDIRNVERLKDIKILELNATPGITLGAAGWVADAIWDAVLEKYEGSQVGEIFAGLKRGTTYMPTK